MFVLPAGSFDSYALRVSDRSMYSTCTSQACHISACLQYPGLFEYGDAREGTLAQLVNLPPSHDFLRSSARTLIRPATKHFLSLRHQSSLSSKSVLLQGPTHICYSPLVLLPTTT